MQKSIYLVKLYFAMFANYRLDAVRKRNVIGLVAWRFIYDVDGNIQVEMAKLIGDRSKTY